jgi:UPF0716 protein FxsA
MWILLLAFVGVPLVEIALFVNVGGWIGLWPTLVTVVATAVVGTALLRLQGLHVLGQVQDSLNRGEMPLEHIFTGACLLVAGALLLTPGFLTDTIGFLLFVPLIRRLIGGLVLETLAKRGTRGSWQNTFTGGQTIIDAEFNEIGREGEDSGGDDVQKNGRQPPEKERK